MASFAVVTFGCRVNQADSLQFEEALVRRGALPASAEHAELVIVNSCSVTSTADQGTRQLVRRIARLNPAARIVVTGCYASREADAVAQLPGVVSVVSNDRKDTLVDDLASHLGLGDAGELDARQDATPQGESGEGPCGHPLAPGLGGRTAFTLRAQTGCEEHCTYCIIPRTRGASRSHPFDDLCEQVARIEGAGYRELILTGVHLGSYGRDLTPSRNLAELLQGVVEAGPSLLVRVGSLEPMDCTGDVLDLLTWHPRIAPHFHLPLQHASDVVLAAMRRPYRLDHYAALVAEIRRRLPHASIGSDVMAGFPGESDRDAELMVDYLTTSPLTHLHVFPYSDRPGTVASTIAPKVHPPTIRDRAGRLRAIGERLSSAFRAGQVGSVRPALTVDDGRSVVTDNYLKVQLPAQQPRNRRVRVRIDRVAPAIEGSVVEDGVDG